MNQREASGKAHTHYENACVAIQKAEDATHWPDARYHVQRAEAEISAARLALALGHVNDWRTAHETTAD